MTVQPDLSSLLVEIRFRKPVSLYRENTGEVLQAAFFNLLRRIDPRADGRAHATAQSKPFTVSPLLHEYGGSDPLPAEAPCYVRLTALSGEMRHLLDRLAASLPCELPLFGSPALFVRALAQEGDPACVDSSGALLAHWLGDGASRTPRVGLEFLTPTFIDCGGGRGLFPEPELVFASVARKWLAFGARPREEAGVFESLLHTIGVRARESVLVSCYRLSSEVMHFRGSGRRRPHMKFGYVGEVEYRIGRDAPDFLRCMFHCLADYAFFSGVGYGTPRGMGQVRPFHGSASRHHGPG